ncbi:MAG: FAD-dependent thymidylate synthase [Candidatus Diapherotrites archaeon]|uniref:FAD-dependent thymidylate synthase n=1 Tax=Candidatus Iainarchaeum sp. TaxID=3101447 RepID=A0A7K4BZP1_9ARCH|nr:FAD-dependent thymidylate synthase [Candidatus Diapherotrites archaeon]
MDLRTGIGLKDPWKELRKNVYRNVEPSVKLIAITEPTKEMKESGVDSNTLAAYTSRHCWESTTKYTDDPKANNELDKQLTRKLVQMGHDTPLQAVNYVFDVDGVSKALQAQWTRHKIGIGWSFRSTRYVKASGNQFVYNTYDYITDEAKVKELLALDEEINKKAIELYDKKLELGSTKQDGRKVMPVSFASHCSFFANARALRHLFKLRLDKHAEWEIRRLSAMLLEEAMKYTPDIFIDLYEKYTTTNEEQK